MMKPLNQVQISFPSNSVNEGFARAAVSAFLAQLDPTVADLSDLKTAVSEAVTNAILHGYRDSLGDGVHNGKALPRGEGRGAGAGQGPGHPRREAGHGAPVHHRRRGAGGAGLRGDEKLLRQRPG